MSFSTLYRLSLFAALFLMAFQFCHRRTDGFSILAISSKRAFDPRWEPRSLSSAEQEELSRALDQPYCYFSRGGQSFVFLSADGNYVLKLFKQSIFEPPHLLNALPLPSFLHKFRKRMNWKRADKLLRDFTSYTLAFNELTPYTGLIYVHLNPTTHFKKNLLIRDKIGIFHELSLDNTNFLIQKRAETVYHRIEREMEDNQIDSAKKTVQSILILAKNLLKAGIRDRDPNIRTNCGFIGDAPMKIDVGRFVPVQKNAFHSELVQVQMHRIYDPFKLWIDEHFPVLSDFTKTTFMELMDSWDEAQ